MQAGLSRDSSCLIHTMSAGLAWPGQEDCFQDGSLTHTARLYRLSLMSVDLLQRMGFLAGQWLHLKNIATDRSGSCSQLKAWAPTAGTMSPLLYSVVQGTIQFIFKAIGPDLLDK